MLHAEEILRAALKLEPAERARIARELLESIEAPAAEELSPAWEEELQRRLREIDAGRVEMIPADQVFSELEADLRAHRASK